MLKMNILFFALIIAVVVIIILANYHKDYIGYAVFNEVNPIILKLYNTQTQLRKNQLEKIVKADQYYILYNVIVPEVFCRNLVRIGRVSDGGKWICNPTNMLSLPECTIYSLGINNDPSFDEDFQQFLNNKCKLRSFDRGSQRPETIKRIEKVNGVFMKALIAGTTNRTKNQYTLKDILNEFGDKRVDILKIDIEGAEYEISDELVSVPMCQILIEIHGKSALNSLNLLRKFSKNGYYLFSYEINGMLHHLSEYSFIHESCLNDYGVKTIYGKYLS